MDEHEEPFSAMTNDVSGSDARNEVNRRARPGSRVMATMESIRGRDQRYRCEAYLLVMEGVESVLAGLPSVRHISGRELCEGIRRCALARFGPMAKEVLNFWGVRSTEDFGNIVFNLVEAGMLLKTDEDRIEDFVGVYDFVETFELDYFKP